jgi:hypothetical protein
MCSSWKREEEEEEATEEEGDGVVVGKVERDLQQQEM